MYSGNVFIYFESSSYKMAVNSGSQHRISKRLNMNDSETNNEEEASDIIDDSVIINDDIHIQSDVMINGMFVMLLMISGSLVALELNEHKQKFMLNSIFFRHLVFITLVYF